MPKQIVNIKDISGGINSDADPKVLMDNQVSYADRVLLDRVGKMKPFKGYSATSISTNPQTSNYGDGAFSFRSDYNLAGSPVATDMVVVQSGSTTILVIEGLSGTTGAGTAVLLTVLSGTYRFDYSNGRLLIYNVNFSTDYSSSENYPVYYYTFIEYTRFATSANSYDVNGWFLFKAVYEQNENPTTFADAFPKFVVDLSQDGDSKFDLGRYVFGYSIIFFDGSASRISIGTTAQDQFEVIDLAKKVLFRPYINRTISDTDANSAGDWFDSQCLKSNVLGINVYISKLTNDVDDKNFQWSFFAELNYEKGVKYHDQAYYEGWSSGSYTVGGSTAAYLPVLQNEPAMSVAKSFAFKSGYKTDDSTHLQAKKIITASNRAFALNIKQRDKTNGDRILISPVGRLNLFPESNVIDIATADGDEWTTAEYFNGNLFAFKNKSLYVVNISSNEPSSYYLQSEHFGAGVNHPCSVCKTEFGLFFANKFGVFSHNGQQITNLCLGKIEDEWTALTYVSPVVGYDRIEKKVLIIAGSDRMTYIYDLKTNSFTKHSYMSSSYTYLSSFFNVGDNLKVCSNVVSNRVLEFDTGLNVNSAVIRTKAFDMGQASVRKKIRRFYVYFDEALADTSDIDLKYSIDDSAFISTGLSKSIINDYTGDNIVRFDLPRSETAYSTRLEITNTTGKTITDISIVYRPKLPK